MALVNLRGLEVSALIRKAIETTEEIGQLVNNFGKTIDGKNRELTDILRELDRREREKKFV